MQAQQLHHFANVCHDTLDTSLPHCFPANDKAEKGLGDVSTWNYFEPYDYALCSRK